MQKKATTENQTDAQLPPVADGLLEKIKNFLWQSYQPVNSMHEATAMLSTMEIYHALQSLYPCPDYGPDDIARWLHEGGFQFTDTGKLHFEWMLKEAI